MEISRFLLIYLNNNNDNNYYSIMTKIEIKNI